MDTILIVDDEPINLDLLRNALKGAYRVLVALGGNKALGILAGDQLPDLLLLDVNMPFPGGIEVCRRMKLDPRLAGIPVIFESAAGDIESKTSGFEAGGVDYITKPFEIPEILARIATHLELSKSRVWLEQQNREIVEAADFREEVERIMRHDLKGPVHSMIGLPELMLDEPNLTEDQRDNLHLIMDSARRMLLMINSSLDLMKMEKGIYHISPAPVDLGKIFSEVMQGRQDPWADEDRFSFAAEGSTTVAGEEMLLYSLFYNLVQNAWEASPRKEKIAIRIQPRSGFQPEGNPYIRTTIRNAGEVPASVRERFFDKFSTCGKDKGTGIGTYSAKLVADTHKGVITVKVDEPGFTTLSVDLPAWQG
jgi:DNA-binding response OmpR family regulator